MSHDAVNNSGGVVESLLYIIISNHKTENEKMLTTQTGSLETGPLTGYKTSA